MHQLNSAGAEAALGRRERGRNWAGVGGTRWSGLADGHAGPARWCAWDAAIILDPQCSCPLFGPRGLLGSVPVGTDPRSILGRLLHFLKWRWIQHRPTGLPVLTLLRIGLLVR